MKKGRFFGGHNDDILLPFHVTIRTVYLDGESEVVTNRLQSSFANRCKAVVFQDSVLLTYENQSILLKKAEFSVLARENPCLTHCLIEEEAEIE